MGLQIDEDRAVGAPTAQRPIVNTEGPRRRAGRHRRAPDEPQQGVRARWHRQAGEEARPGFTPDLDRHGPLRGGQAPRALRAPVDQPSEGLGERPAGAARVPAVEASHVELEPHAVAERGEIGGAAHVGAVRRGAARATIGAGRAQRLRAHDEEELAVSAPDLRDAAPGDGVRRQRHTPYYPGPLFL